MDKECIFISNASADEQTLYSAVILAGGNSRRMGMDKALLTLGGQTCLDRILSTVQMVADDVWIVRQPGQAALQQQNTVCDIHPGQGPLAGMESGLRRVKGAWAFVVSVDAPLAQIGLIRYLLTQIPQRGSGSTVRAIVPVIGEQVYPLVAVYHRSVHSVITKLLSCNKRKVLDFLTQIDVRYCTEEEWGEHDPERVSFLMMNTPQEWEQMARLLAERGREDEA